MHQIIDNNYIKSMVDKLRHTGTEPAEFYRITTIISQLLAYEALKSIEYSSAPIPIWTGEEYNASRIEQHNLVILPILRAGIGMLDGVRHLLPAAQVQMLGMFRNEKTLEPVWYYNKLPADMSLLHAILIDPMLATGGSLCDAVCELKRRNCQQITILAIVASPQGIAKIENACPNAKIYVAARDQKLNEQGYIIPGLGDAGDRIFNT